MLKPFLTLILGLFGFGALAQKKSDTAVYYIKFPSQVVQKIEDADYILKVISPNDRRDNSLFVLKGYYPNGKLMFITNSTDNNNIVYQGQYLGFYPNGNKMVVKRYYKGVQTGDDIVYYPNGGVYTVTKYKSGKEGFLSDCLDSAGVKLASDGKGRWIMFDENFKNISSEGSVNNGVQEGLWKGKINDSVDYEKTFDKGHLISAKKIYKTKPLDSIYTSVDTIPKYPGGLEAFYRFLGKTIRYPADAREDNIQGKVLIQLVVEKDGSLNNFKVFKGIGHGCDDEALKAVMLSSPWLPGIKDGKPVSVTYTVPIQFTLSQ